MAGPAATIGSMHVCPMVTGTTPHVGGPVIGPGAPTVLINGKPAAVMGDTVTCAGPPDTIVQGESTVLINGKPAATVGCMTAHGGSITVGEPNVLIGTGGSGTTSVMPINKIPFPDISFVSKVKASIVGQGKSLAKAQTNQEQIRQEAQSSEGEPMIYNVRWLKDEQRTTDGRITKSVKVAADVINIDDGETITFNIERKNPKTEEVEQIEVTASVKDSEAISDWEITEPNGE